ncbi:MAG: DUF47 family protein [Coriobacteriales bacterium]|jgi:uncharacterized protein Yka (UPF0111/DUF47 family)|nr:DUF47 family protein [Coriobacteriales bacterium]
MASHFNYFDAFERMTALACQEAKMLVEIVNRFNPSDVLDDFNAMHAIENACDEENHQIFTHVAGDFVPPIEREDITDLAQNLDTVADYIEDVQQRFYMFNVQEMNPAALQLVGLIEKSVCALHEAMQDFGNFKKSKQLHQKLIRVNDYEEEADKLYLASVHDLYANHADDPVYVLAWTNLFSLMERCIDTCEHVADVVSTIVLKNT